MDFSQASAVLTTVVKQATGQTTIAAITSPADFVSVAQSALKTGYDPVLNALSQVWSRTIFSSRDYKNPLDSLMMDLPRYGNAVRKISAVAGEMVNDARQLWPVHYDAVGHSANPLGNGQSVDMYAIKKQEVQQTNFYGTAVYEQDFTIFRDQFDAAFNSAEEFSRFNAMNMQERYNDRESYKEAIARGLQANYIAALLDEGNTSRVVHLLSEYNTQTGLSLAAQTVYKPENFAPFMRWVYARIKTLAQMMRVRSNMFQTVINGKPILRTTDARNLRVALASPVINQIESMVMSDTYHDNYLKYAQFDSIEYWQSIDTPDSIAVKAVYTDTNGAVKNANTTVEQAGIFGLMHDRDAIGYASVNEWAAMTPFNTKGAYWNEHYHNTFKTITDMTEKGIVLLLD